MLHLSKNVAWGDTIKWRATSDDPNEPVCPIKCEIAVCNFCLSKGGVNKGNSGSKNTKTVDTYSLTMPSPD